MDIHLMGFLLNYSDSLQIFALCFVILSIFICIFYWYQSRDDYHPWD